LEDVQAVKVRLALAKRLLGFADQRAPILSPFFGLSMRYLVPKVQNSATLGSNDLVPIGLGEWIGTGALGR
jgi:hypothetical protein